MRGHSHATTTCEEASVLVLLVLLEEVGRLGRTGRGRQQVENDAERVVCHGWKVANIGSGSSSNILYFFPATINLSVSIETCASNNCLGRCKQMPQGSGREINVPLPGGDFQNCTPSPGSSTQSGGEAALVGEVH